MYIAYLLGCSFHVVLFYDVQQVVVGHGRTGRCGASSSLDLLHFPALF